MKKFFVVLAILFIGILLAGCTQPAAPVATPTPTAVPTTVVTTAVPTTIQTTETVVVIVNKTPNATPKPTATKAIPMVNITFTEDMTISPDINAIVPVGGKVIWINQDPYKPHAIQAIDVQTGKYFGGMDTVLIPFGTSFEVTFDKEGAYSYKTVYQPDAVGKIVVTK